ncbi:MurR/RpiR family transcriptional regulator [Enterococcus sp. LJL90]
MVIEQLQKRKNFTLSEKQIAEYLLLHLEELGNLTIDELAKATFTSKATIIRFCKKLKLKGFIDLQKEIAKELVAGKHLANIIDDEPVNQETTSEEVMGLVPAIYENALTNARLSLNKNQLKRIINRFKHIGKLDIYGSGITYSIASMAAFKFATLGVPVEAFNGLNEHYVIATRQKENRLAILLSFSGNNPLMATTAKYLKQAGVFVIGIGNHPENALAQQVDEYIALRQKQSILSMEVMTSITAVNYVLDILFVSQLVGDYQQNTQNSLMVIKQELANNHVNDTKVSKIQAETDK